MSVTLGQTVLPAAPAGGEYLGPGAADRVRTAILLSLALLLPSAFNPFGVLAFEPFKLTIVRFAALGLGLTILLAPNRVLRLPAAQAELSKTRPLVLAAGAYLATQTLATLLSIQPLPSALGSYDRLQGLLTLLALAVIGLSVARLRGSVEPVLDCLILGSAPVCLYALLQQLGLDPLVWLNRTFGPASLVGSSTALADFLAMLLPVTVLRLVSAARPLKQAGRLSAQLAAPALWYVMLLGILALQVAALLATGVRGGLLGAAAGLGLYAGLLLWRRSGGRHSPLLLAGLALGALLIIALNWPGEPLDSLTSRSAYLERWAAISPRELAGRERLLIWQAAVETWAHSGWRLLVGFGPETQGVALEAYFPPEIARRVSDLRFDRVHNEALDHLLTSGVLGLAGYATLLVAAAVAGRRMLRAASNPALPAALLAGLTAHVVSSSLAFSSAVSLLVAAILIGMLARGEPLAADKSQCNGRYAQPAREHRPAGPLRRGLAVVGSALLVAIFASPILADLAYTRGLAYHAGEDPHGEAAWLRRASAMAPARDLYGVAVGTALANQVAAERSSNRRDILLEDSEAALRQAITVAPVEPYNYFHLGQTLELRAEVEQRPALRAQAVAAYDEAARLAPSRVLFADAAGEALLRLGRPEQALDRFSRAMELAGPTAERLARSGDAQVALGQIAEARASYGRALELAAQSAVAHHGLANLLYLEGDLEGALKAARRAVRYQSRDWRWREQLARLELETGSRQAALVEARAAARFAPPWEQSRLRALVAQLRGE